MTTPPATPPTPTKAQSERRRTFIRAELAQIALTEKRKGVAPAAEMDQAIAERADSVRSLAMAEVPSLARKLAGKAPAVAEKIMRQTINTTLTKMAGGS